MTIISLVSLPCVTVKAQNEFSPVSSTGIPYSIIIGDITLNNGMLPTSTAIGVFDDTLCVGQCLYSGSINQQLIAWEGDVSQNLSGFIAGQDMSFKVKLFVNGDYYILDAVPSYTQGNGTFGYGNYSVVNLAVTTTLVGLSELNIKTSLSGYPNPFSSNIKFDLGNKFDNVRIVDLNGKVIYNERISNSAHQFLWSGKNNKGGNVQSGLYFIIFSSDIDLKISKVIYQNSLGNHIN